MSEEAAAAGAEAGAEAAKEVAKAAPAAAPAASDGDDPAQKVAQLEGKLKEAEKAVAVYNKLDERYRSDASYREAFDKAWKGEKAARGDDGGDDADPISETKSEVAKLKEEIANLRGVYATDKIVGSRSETNMRYESDFTKLASEAGYDPGSEAFDILYSDTIRESQKVATKYGLTDENGNPDPLRAYNKDFIKKAFDNAFDKHKKAGFDEAWKRKVETEKIKKQKETSATDELSTYFDPKKNLTREQRAKNLEASFRHRFKGADLKIVS